MIKNFISYITNLVERLRSKILKAGMSVPSYGSPKYTNHSGTPKMINQLKNIGFKSSRSKKGTASDKVFKNKAIFDNTLPETSFL